MMQLKPQCLVIPPNPIPRLHLIAESINAPPRASEMTHATLLKSPKRNRSIFVSCEFHRVFVGARETNISFRCVSWV